jgi:hypothetical protein
LEIFRPRWWSQWVPPEHCSVGMQQYIRSLSIRKKLCKWKIRKGKKTNRCVFRGEIQNTICVYLSIFTCLIVLLVRPYVLPTDSCAVTISF